MSTNADEFARRLGASVPGAALSGLQSLPGFESLTEHDVSMPPGWNEFFPHGAHDD